MSGKLLKAIQVVLVGQFIPKHIDAALGHFQAAQNSFLEGDWEGVSQKSGKFIEAIAKALVLHAGKSIANPRQFKAGSELRQIENVPNYPDSLRLAIPRAGIFVYEIVSNRGGRHDAHDVDANEMDAKAIIPLISWILAEMVRFCSQSNPATAWSLIEELTTKIYPYLEEIDGRTYVNFQGLSPGENALLILYRAYPKRVQRQALIESVVRHGARANAASIAVHRLKNFVDDDNGDWKLRGLGRQKAEELLKRLHISRP